MTPWPRRERALTAALPVVALAVGIGLVATFVGRAVPVVGGPVPAVALGALVGWLVRRRHQADGASGDLGPLRPGVQFASSRVLQFAVVLLGAQLSIAEVLRIGGERPSRSCSRPSWSAWSPRGGRPPAPGVRRAADAHRRGDRHLRGLGDRGGHPGDRGGERGRRLRDVDDLPLQHRRGVRLPTARTRPRAQPARLRRLRGHRGERHVVGRRDRDGLRSPGDRHRRGREAGPDAHDHPDRGRAGRPGGATHRPGRGRLRQRSRPGLRVFRLVPWFLSGSSSWCCSAPSRPAGRSSPGFATAATFLITVALAAIGVSTDFGALRRAGFRPMLLGIALWALVAGTSLGAQAVFGLL